MSRNPKRRFCDPVCKSRWWRASNNDAGTPQATADSGRHDTDTATAQPTTTSTASMAQHRTDTDPAVTANAVTQPYDPYVAGHGTGQAPSAIQNCPNCHQLVAVISLLVTSAAAYVNTP